MCPLKPHAAKELRCLFLSFLHFAAKEKDSDLSRFRHGLRGKSRELATEFTRSLPFTHSQHSGGGGFLHTHVLVSSNHHKLSRHLRPCLQRVCPPFSLGDICFLCSLYRSHWGHSSVRVHHRPGSPLLPGTFDQSSPDRLQALGTQRGRHCTTDHAAAPGDPEPPGGAKISPLPRGEPLHPFLLPARRTGWSQDPGGVRCGYEKGLNVSVC